MKNSYRPFIFILLAFLIAEVVPSKGFSQTLEQHISSDTLQAGDIFTFDIILKKDRSYDDVIYPDSTFFTKSIGFRDRKIFRVAGFEDSLQYKLQFWGISDATLPTLPVKLISNGDTTTMYTQPVNLHFQSVLKNPNAKFRPLKPIFAFAAARWPLWLGSLGFLILIAIIAYYLYKNIIIHRKQKKNPDLLPSHF